MSNVLAPGDLIAIINSKCGKNSTWEAHYNIFVDNSPAVFKVIVVWLALGFDMVIH